VDATDFELRKRIGPKAKRTSLVGSRRETILSDFLVPYLAALFAQFPISGDRNEQDYVPEARKGNQAAGSSV
jgi:hypothetical protein